MKIGIGIDTGGTCTDAVAYDFYTQEVLESAKSTTTKNNLSIGIGAALDQISAELLRKADVVSLSTTLATNACVENHGGRVGLVLIGVDEKVLNKVGGIHGLPPAEEILMIDAEVNIDGNVISPPDWDRFNEEFLPWAKGKQAFAVVQFGARNSGAGLEKKAKKIISELVKLPVVCGHELFCELNMLRRAAGAYLNARLLPVIDGFLKSIRKALSERNVDAPVVIVRSDGTLMSEGFAAMRPVETLLCGPAASVMFGAQKAQEQNSLIIDMGGTTSDVAMVKDGQSVHTKRGISIGSYKTFVKGMYINTFGLGGDSAIRYDRQKNLSLASNRIVPICMLAQQHEGVVAKLEKLVEQKKVHTFQLHEFYCLAKEPTERELYTKQEVELCDMLKKEPLLLEEAANSLGCDLYNINTARLEKEGVVIKSGLTPTDIMHIRGDFSLYEKKASELVLEYFSLVVGKSQEEICEEVYDLVRKKLYCELVEMALLLCPQFEKGIGELVKENIALGWQAYKEKMFISPSYKIGATLVGLGAPIHVFLPEVARALGTKCVIPKHANVANAVGALVGNVSADSEVDIAQKMNEFGEEVYVVYCEERNEIAEEMQEAIKIATKDAIRMAKEEAIKRGAGNEIAITTEIRNESAISADGAEVFLGCTVVARAIGKIVG